ncbi:apoptosis-inducing factor 2, partial [Phenoliferia sp. Uapishka_3]
MTRNVIVLGGSYAGSRAAELLAKSLPSTHRVVLVDRQSHFNPYIPYTNLLGPAVDVNTPPSTPPRSSDGRTEVLEHIPSTKKSVVVNASVTRIGEGFIDIDRDVGETDADTEDVMDRLTEHFESTGLGEGRSKRRLSWDYLVYALGCTLPPPLVSPARTKESGVSFLKAQQKIIQRARSILVVGGGALGLQYATDIADYYNSPHNQHLHYNSSPSLPKKVTLIHSRQRFLPLYDEKVDVEIKRRLDVLGINVILGERLTLPSDEELAAQEKEGKMNKIVTSKGEVVEFDLLLRCTGQIPNSDLLKEFLPEAINDHGFVNVRPTLQVATLPDNIPRKDIYSIGDVADMGVIKAGHTGWNAAGTAVQNIMTSIVCDSSSPDLKLVEFDRTPPQIKVTLGLNHSVSELLPAMGATKTEVKTSSSTATRTPLILSNQEAFSKSVTVRPSPALPLREMAYPALPSEIVAYIIDAAISSFTYDLVIERRSILLSTSLVCQLWRREAQRLLFTEESRLETREQINGWCVLAGRYHISEVTLSVCDSAARLALGLEWATPPTARDVKLVLDSMGSDVTHLDINVALLSDEVLHHPRLNYLQLLELNRDDDNTTPIPPISDSLRFSLNVLVTSFDFREVDANNGRKLVQALESTITTATHLKLDMDLDPDSDLGGQQVVGLGNLIRAASKTLQSLEIFIDYHPYIDESIKALECLTKLIDGCTGTIEEISTRCLLLPKSLKHYYPLMGGFLPLEVVETLRENVLTKLLEDDGLLPELEEMTDQADEGDEVQWLQAEVIRRRPGVRFVRFEDSW